MQLVQGLVGAMAFFSLVVVLEKTRRAQSIGLVAVFAVVERRRGVASCQQVARLTWVVSRHGQRADGMKAQQRVC